MLRVLLSLLVIVKSTVSDKCTPPQVYKGDCPTACPPKCSDPFSLDPLTPCIAVCGKPGCYCPNDKPIEKCNSNLNIECLKKPEKCCMGGMVWDECGDACTRTCENPRVYCRARCYPHCVCPKDKPIWHEGKCIPEAQCTCPNKKMKAGCDKCNLCTCKKRTSSCPLLKKPCPNVHTKEGLDEIWRNGCYRMNPAGDRCIFYSPCIDSQDEFSCKTHPKGFCKECCKCSCPKEGGPICDVKIISCQDQFRFSAATSGCWALVKGACRFVMPCPEQPSKTDTATCKKNGKRSCMNCRNCECVHGVWFCDRNPPCKDPTRGQSKGCWVAKKYGDCEYVSPCPNDRDECLLDIYLPEEELKKNFCYVLNKKTQRCEFISPCPGKCTQGQNVCNKCNECTCKKGKIKCTDDECGDPIDKGCWVEMGSNCVFRSPCPFGHTPCKSDRTPTEATGCWAQVHGTCEFFFPCDNLS